MDNRTIIAIVLIVLLWSGYSLFFTPYQPQQVNETEVSTSVPPTVTTEASVSQLLVPDNSTLPSGEEKIVQIHSDLYEIELSTKGATVKSVSFNNYKETMEESSEQLYLLNNTDFSKFSLKTTGSDGLAFPADLIYTLQNTEKDRFNVEGDNLVISFQANYNNLSIIKEFIFYKNSYHVGLNIHLYNNNDIHTSGKFNISLVTPWSEDEKGDFYSFTGPLTFDGNKLQEDKPKDISKKPVIYRDFSWSGFTNKYFLQALHSESELEQVFIAAESETVINQFTTPSFYLSQGERISFEFTSYFGPKEYEHLAFNGASFEEAIHFGFFHFLAKPLFDVLKFFYSYLNNYGFSIILLTVCIKLIFWPLTQKSYKSMQGMQKLQPEMKRLKEKYADNKQRLNQEMMAFYKENKVNPLGGCLPIVIQIPVFFSLYKVLLDSIELRHAPFMFWIADLSAKDPLYITPLIMGATMFLQQKLTPTNMDPTQEKIMLMMPVVFTFMFLNFPSGLVLYWLVNNLLTIFQQLLIRRKAAA